MIRDIDGVDPIEPAPTDDPAIPPVTESELAEFEQRIEAMFRTARVVGDAMLVPDATFGDFRIVRRIGSGGMARVYEAIELPLQRRVALKVLSGVLGLSPLAIASFHREAIALGRQHHPGIVAIHRFGQIEGSYFIAQELVGTGRTLADEIRERRDRYRTTGQRDRQAEALRVATLFLAVADAITHVHATGVIHRDLKPSNILLDERSEPKVSDFGLAYLGDDVADGTLRAFLGTPCYVAPEQALGRGIGADARSDVFSLGVTMYERLTLERPFDGADFAAVIDAIQKLTPPDPLQLDPAIDPLLATICVRAMQKDPAARYASMREMALELRRWHPL